VTRTYDSRRRNEAVDFGYGWSVDYQNARVQKNAAPGFNWEVYTQRAGPVHLDRISEVISGALRRSVIHGGGARSV
jgi:hypothetical protein